MTGRGNEAGKKREPISGCILKLATTIGYGLPSVMNSSANPMLGT